MQFIIVGAGGVGGYLGVRLTQAGHDVAYLVRGSNLAALRDTGIVLDSPDGEVSLGPQRASDAAAALGIADVVIVTVKLYDLAGVAPRLAPLIGPETAVLPLQNGVDSYSILSEALGPAAILKGVVSIKAYLTGPGTVVCKSPFCRIRFGEADGRRSRRIEKASAAFNGCIGVSAETPADIDAEIWLKFIMLASFSAVSCLGRAAIGQVLDNPESRALVIDAAREAMAVARANGVALPSDIEDVVLRQVRDMPRDGRPSMLEDLESGRRLELPFLSGTVVRLGRKHSVATPIHATAYRALAMHENGKSG